METCSSAHQEIVIKKKKDKETCDMDQNGDLGQVRSEGSGLVKAGGEAMSPRRQGQC